MKQVLVKLNLTEPRAAGKLHQVAPPVDVSHWTYSFAVWPQVEIFRHVVEYEQDWAERAARREQSLSSRFSRWLRKKGDGSGSG